MNDVLKHFPKAFVHRSGPLKYEIRRPREKTDPQALVNYVLMSGIFSTAEAAWGDAYGKIRAEPQLPFIS